MKKPIQCSGNKDKIEQTHNNCIQCHMPIIQSKTMKVQVATEDQISVAIRTHLIGIYNLETK